MIFYQLKIKLLNIGNTNHSDIYTNYGRDLFCKTTSSKTYNKLLIIINGQKINYWFTSIF